MPNDPSIWPIALPILTAVGGYIGGIFSEPLKHILKSYLDRRAMRTVVYLELATNLDTILALGMNREKGYEFKVLKGTLDVNLSFKNYEYAESQPLIFHQLKEAAYVRSLYSGIRTFFKDCKTREHILDTADMIKDKLTKDLGEGGLNIKRLKPQAGTSLQQYLRSLSKH